MPEGSKGGEAAGAVVKISRRQREKTLGLRREGGRIGGHGELGAAQVLAHSVEVPLGGRYCARRVAANYGTVTEPCYRLQKAQIGRVNEGRDGRCAEGAMDEADSLGTLRVKRRGESRGRRGAWGWPTL